MLCQFVGPLKQTENNDFNHLLFFVNAYWLSHGKVKKTNYTVNLNSKFSWKKSTC